MKMYTVSLTVSIEAETKNDALYVFDKMLSDTSEEINCLNNGENIKVEEEEADDFIC